MNLNIVSCKSPVNSLGRLEEWVKAVDPPRGDLPARPPLAKGFSMG